MRSGEVIISADSHVTEPEDLWARELPLAVRGAVPVMQPTASSKSKPPLKGLDGAEGGRDPRERSREMDVDGVSAEVLYPTLGLRHFAVTDVKLQEACFRVYNDWLVDYCQAASERLIGLGCISVYDIDHAIAEMDRCKNLGLKGVLIWQSPPAGLQFSSNHYERFWAAAQEVALPVSLHIASGFPRGVETDSGDGLGRTRGSTIERMVDAINAVFDFIFSGVLHRYPGLKLVIVENEIGWLPFMLQQWDAYCWRHAGILDAPIDNNASYYFCRQIYATFFDDPVGTRHLDTWGIDNCMWSSDFPHRFSTWPHSREAIERDLHHLTPSDRRKVVGENVMGLYDVIVPAVSETEGADA